MVWPGVPCHDVLLIIALAIQACMVWAKRLVSGSCRKMELMVLAGHYDISHRRQLEAYQDVPANS